MSTPCAGADLSGLCQKCGDKFVVDRVKAREYIINQREGNGHSQNRKVADMAEKKNLTRKDAINNALVFCNYANVTALRIEGYEDIDWVETANVLGKMHEQLSKPRKAVVSKARKGNEALAKWVYDHAGDEVTTKDVVAMGKPEISTTQKAAAVLRVATELGLFVKGDGKKVAYAKVYGE